MSKQSLTQHFLIAALAMVSIAGQASAKSEAVADRALSTQTPAQPAVQGRVIAPSPMLITVSDREAAQPRGLAPTALVMTCHRAGSRMVC